MPTLATHTLGCKLNFAETSHLVRRFVDAGYVAVDFHDVADLYIVNTCTVTAMAEKKCRMVIRQAVAQNPAAIVAVVGCFAQNAAAEVAKIPGVSLILGNDRKHLLFEEVQRLQGRAASLPVNPTDDSFAARRSPDGTLAFSSGDRTRTFFKIQDGCDYFCTYCAIPFARGRSRSSSIEDTMAMARQIVATGAKEVVLTGVNTGTFGLNQNESFIDLLRQLDQLDGIERYRISSIEPNLITDEIIQFVAQSRHFAHHFHIPIQAGSDVVLKQMHRRYDTAFYADKLAAIKEAMPESCIAADLMVGFRGETDLEFERSCQFIESLPLSYLHIFTYSERPNTAALKMDGRVPVHVRRQRSEVMHQLSERKKRAFYEANLDTIQSVLWESDTHQLGEGKVGPKSNAQENCDMVQLGWTDNYIRVGRPYDPSKVNTLEKVRLAQLLPDDDLFLGIPVGEEGGSR